MTFGAVAVLFVGAIASYLIFEYELRRRRYAERTFADTLEALRRIYDRD